ncbi:hypothetical protein M406DRAFT_340190 [Cryphonectria parasitica EP155]|uniref:DUF7721 domain-containing protein n=1 Tax=Cryphonectria parasitica (strain ATCC 38755 / EP155) TaxID=660469 RepID=A0A9P4Y169_CRYP1|nr:uncharacterized protein M406DRAFT_340190 [Cryphonectria parasitica EP155]KAF3764624.1 hypothetical protein M406DRAFT_340190 [Cryphonectria parasitica EP155]
MSYGREQPGGAYGGGGGVPNRGYAPRDDSEEEGFHQRAAEHAARNAGDSGGSDFFSGIMGQFMGKKTQLANEDVDEQAAVAHHKKFFGGEDDGSEADSGSMGNAAAMQALKMFAGGSGGSSGGSQSEFIGLAMSEASKLFDSQASSGRVSSGASKESAVQQAGEMAFKMYLKSQGGSSGGLMSLASKFM